MVRAAFERHGVQGRVERFIDAMDREMKAAGLVVSRAGATTLAEVTAAGRPAILIPLPTATDDHQRHNARALEKAGAAELIEQERSDRRATRRPHHRAGGRSRAAPPNVGSGATTRQAARGGRHCGRSDRVSRERREASGPASGATVGRGAPRLNMSGVLGQARRIHFIGVGGIGMSGIAELLVNLGYEVSGSDMQRTDITDRLESLGARITQGHDARNVSDAEVVVYSSAVRSTNPEMVAARERGLTVVARAEVLAELMQLRQGIAVAGAHGKTTTTSMIALVLDVAGLDPTVVIGGRVSSFGSNAKLGRGKYLVAEADESDRSFLKLSPRFAVITNIDREHLEAYRDFDDLKAAFAQFANGVPANGAVIMCIDDVHLREMRGDIKRHVVTYGFGRFCRRDRAGRADEGIRIRVHGARTQARRPSGRARAAAARHSGTAQRAERARGRGDGERARHRVERYCARARRISGRRAPFSAARRSRRCRRRRRLRTSSDRDRGCRRGGEADCDRTLDPGVSAASLYAHPIPVERVRPCVHGRRRADADRYLRRRRRPDPGRDARYARGRPCGADSAASCGSCARLPTCRASLRRWRSRAI